MLNEKNLNKLWLSKSNGVVLIDMEAIEYMSSEGGYCNIFTVCGKKYTSSKSIGYYEQVLCGYHFLRVHHKYLVNMVHIVEIQNGNPLRLKLRSGVELVVTRQKKSDLMRYYIK
ncbi:MAG: LytTR family transcriptional regulator [Bacteroidales bacterium]|nr:LytTR family transcriptional regulator [Bacteroidales bacterium]